MKSSFEKLSDKVLFRIVKKIYDSFDYSVSFGDIYDYLDSNHRLFGMDEFDSIDVSYIHQLIKLNQYALDSGEIVGSLERPTIKQFEFKYSVIQYSTDRIFYRDTVYTYGDEKSAIKSVEFLDENGDFLWWEGKEIDTQNLSAESESPEISWNTLKRIK
jgi:hypothetical protein